MTRPKADAQHIKMAIEIALRIRDRQEAINRGDEEIPETPTLTDMAALLGKEPTPNNLKWIKSQLTTHFNAFNIVEGIISLRDEYDISLLVEEIGFKAGSELRDSIFDRLSKER